MRIAVLRVGIDPNGELTGARYEQGLAGLRERGLQVIATPAVNLPATDREIELLLGNLERVGQAHYLDMCSEAFGLPASGGVLTYISRGTDEDVLAVLGSFGLKGSVWRSERDGGELVTVVLDPDDAHRVTESRLQTALEAALNSEVDVRWQRAETISAN